MSLTNDEVAWVLATPKQVTEQVRWKRRSGRTPRHECSFSIRIPLRDDPQVAILGRVEATFDRYKAKCAFIYKGICIRRWESTGPHRNPDGQLIGGEHKHEWDEVHEDRQAYVPDDIDSTSRDSGLMGFLDECAITIDGPGGYAAQLPGLEGDV